METITRLDLAVLDSLQKLHCAFLNAFFSFFTYIGDGGAVWILAAILLMCFKKYRKTGVCVSLALIMEVLLNEKIIKELVRRPRPFTLRPEIDTIVHRPSSFSFPSGHTCSSFAAATVIFMYNKRLGIAAYAVAALIGFSRNYFFIHYPTDVICGALFGMIYGIAAVMIVRGISGAVSRRSSSTGDSQDR